MYRKPIQASALAAMISVSAAAGAQQDDRDSAAGEIVARVNGEPITRAEAEAMVDQRGRGRQSLNDLNAQQRAQMVNRLVEMALLASAAREKGLADKPDIKAQIQVTERLTLARALIQQLRREEGAITEEEVRRAYNERYGGDGGVAELKARHILVDDEAKAKSLIKKLDNGADFAKLADKHSTGPTSSKGGDLGWFAPDEMVTAFSKAAKELDVGEYTDQPVKTQYGFHIIKLDDTRQADKPAFADKRQELRQKLASNRIQDKIEALRSQADIEISEGWDSPGNRAGN